MSSGEPLSEAPEIIEPSDFGLSNETYRYNFTRHLMNLPSQVTLDNNDEFELFRAGEGRVIYFYMLEKQFGRLAYFIKCEVVEFTFVGQTVTQVALWRDNTVGITGLANRVFFDYLLKDFPTILSDEQQTLDGKRFWERQMAVAQRKGLKVGLADFTNKSVEWCDKPFFEWVREHETAWTSDPASQRFRFVISR